jgi:hypothetical protein
VEEKIREAIAKGRVANPMVERSQKAVAHPLPMVALETDAIF